MRKLIAVFLCLMATAAWADPPKRWMSIFDFMRAYHAAVQDEPEAQEPQKVQQQDRSERRGHWHKPKPPCVCGDRVDYGGAVNYPPYDLQP